MDKKAMPKIIKSAKDLNLSPEIIRLLKIRQEASKTSVRKYVTMLASVCRDGRIRNLLQFYGANRTGRWAGRLLQIHNLPQNIMDEADLALARELVKTNNYEALALLFTVPFALSQLIRTALVPKKGNRLLVADFSAIEARVIAWLSGEKWRIDVFNTHGKIYEASAAAMFHIPIESITKDSDYRKKGKVSELALGYGGGPNALIQMGALEMGVDEDELPKLVRMWRNANKKIVKYWYDVEAAAVQAVETGRPHVVRPGITFYVANNILYAQLPSGRCLAYQRPTLVEGHRGLQLCYYGMDQTTKMWIKQRTYGGKLVENLCQAIARDCLADAMLRVNKAGYPIVLHVHDELVAEIPDDDPRTIKDVEAIMGTPIPWAKGLPLAADGFETYYYKK
jgi:DNA polymerase